MAQTTKPVVLNETMKEANEYLGRMAETLEKRTPTINEIVDLIYPVGAIYMSVNDVNPQTLFGGTWEAYGSADAYLRLGGNGNGGSNSIKLSANQIPSLTTGNQSADHTHGFAHTHGTDSKGDHKHGLVWRFTQTGSNIRANALNYETEYKSTDVGTDPNAVVNAGAHTHTTNSQSTSTTGKNSVNHTHTYTNSNQQNVSITPKYVQVYAWKRTA